ncbi:hypothetical protein BKA70DRAFT_373634 [Coprinopsis sp. MPI-PUGE-AT-0042]|nr:hypothetical protein BKA70DRAFT_373634 [Coprinopsis sp. MPI-PUGE-AT-0042]
MFSPHPSLSSAHHPLALSTSNLPITYHDGSAAPSDTFASTAAVASRNMLYVVQTSRSYTPSPPPFATVCRIPLPTLPSIAASPLDIYRGLKPQVPVAEGYGSQLGMQMRTGFRGSWSLCTPSLRVRRIDIELACCCACLSCALLPFRSGVFRFWFLLCNSILPCFCCLLALAIFLSHPPNGRDLACL